MFKRMATMLALGLLALTSFGADAARPNVLMIVSDDLAARLACYGDPMAKTPHLDRLAARGVRFERAYCQYPLCNPSRTSFLTGLRPDTTRVWNNQVQFRDTTPDAQSLGQTFQKAGYYVARVGKLYHYGVPTQIGTDGMDDPNSWQERFNPKGRDVDDTSLIEAIALGPDGKARWETGGKLGLGARLSRLAAEGEDSEQTDGKVADQAIRLLDQHKDKPFFLCAGFYRPHTPYVAPKKYFDLYPLEKIVLPTVPDGYRDTVPAAALLFKKEEEAMTDRQRREAIQAYFAAMSFMDAQVGRLVDALDQRGLATNTIVVFLSDHGYHLYEHELWQKRTLFENSARVPLIVAAPGLASGATCRRTVELIDLHPTLAELAGLDIPKGLDGVSIAPLVRDPAASRERPAITQVNREGNKGGRPSLMGYSLRTEKWRYNDWGTAGCELYDEEADPTEMHNLAAQEKFQPVLAELRARLHGMIPGSRPPSGNSTP